MKNIYLVGNPNVGKSVIFNRLTGTDVIVSNYPGTTVEFTKGYMRIKKEKFGVIDAPGIYTLNPTSKAEKIAAKMLQGKVDLIVNIIDATNLERNLNLTLQLLKKRIPMVLVLNFWDETKHAGIDINLGKLEKILGIPCISTCGITGEGIKELVEKISQPKVSHYDYLEEDRWSEIGSIIENVQKVTYRHHTFWEKLGDASVKTFSGIPIALVILFLSFKLIRFIGEGLIVYVFEPIFEKFWAPLILKLSGFLGSGGILHDILIGKLKDGGIDFGESFGLLTTGFFVPFGAVLPYVFAFYIVLSFLEDSGYLPRLAVLVDTFMHKFGLHGLAIIPMMLGFGCNVPAALSTRIMETRRERFIAATLMAIAIPCMAQIAMIAGLAGKYGAKAFGMIFATLFFVWVFVGFLMKRFISGESPEIFTEIPPYRLPYFKGLLKKVWIRVKWFLKEAIPFVLLGVFLVNILYTLGIIQWIGKFTAPIVTGILGLPREAVGALVVGFLRKDVAVGMLAPLDLTLKQVVIACVVLAMYFPCVATFATLLRELGLIDMIKSALVMVFSTLIVGSILNLIL